MTSSARTQAIRYAVIAAAIALITAIDFHLHVNPTTAALMFLVAVLLISAYWGLRYALALALGATALFNYYFLPPIRTFTIADPQNWIALFAFLVTALVASNLAERARSEAEQAKLRRRDVERLYGLSQRLLASENVLELLNALPLYVQETFSVNGIAVIASDQPSVYRSSLDANFDETVLRSTLLRGEPRHVHALFDAGAGKSDAGVRALLNLAAEHPEQLDVTLRACRYPHRVKLWKALPAEQFDIYLEAGPYKGAAEKEIRLAETLTVLKGESIEQAVRTIICREIVRGPKKDRWHPLYTTRKAEVEPVAVLDDFRMRQ